MPGRDCPIPGIARFSCHSIALIKLEKYVSGKEGDLSTHLNEGYVVRVHFSMENYSATDALKQYLKQIAELKY